MDKSWISRGPSVCQVLYSGEMKSSWITALTIVGVLGTSTAALAINADTLSGIERGTIGNAIEVLVPVVSADDDSEPVISTTPVPSSPPSVPDSSGGQDGSSQGTSPAPVISGPSESTGSSGSDATTDDSQVENQDEEDSADDSEDEGSSDDD